MVLLHDFRTGFNGAAFPQGHVVIETVKAG